MILPGNCALEIMGFPTYGFGGGRLDAWEADNAIYWGPEIWNPKDVDSFDSMVTRDKRWRGQNGDADYDLENPLAATHQALIYVNPEGPYASGDPMGSARDIRIAFTRMAMNDEETVALIAGGHAFGKSHGMVSANEVGPPPEIAPMEAMGLGWHNPKGPGFAQYTMTNGIEGSWTPNPTQWDNSYLENLFKFEWEQTKSLAGALQWKPTDPNAPKTFDAHVEGQMNDLMMMTSDIALKVDPEYRKVCEKFLADFDAFTQAFSKAWHKLTHRDMGPRHRYLGRPEVTDRGRPAGGRTRSPSVTMSWSARQKSPRWNRQSWLTSPFGFRSGLHRLLRGCDLSRQRQAWRREWWPPCASQSQKDWAVNRRAAPVIEKLRGVMSDFNGKQASGKKISLADLIVLGGCAGVERAARDAGVDASVPFTPGCVDTTQKLTDVEMFEWLKPIVDGFRNYVGDNFKQVSQGVAPEEFFLDNANLMKLTAPEWTVLTGGLRVLNVNHDGSDSGVFTDKVGVLTNDFFVNLTDTDLVWERLTKRG